MNEKIATTKFLIITFALIPSLFSIPTRIKRSTSDEIGWLEISYTEETLPEIPLGLQRFLGATRNRVFNAEIISALGQTDSTFRNALNTKSFGSLSSSNVQSVQNVIAFALADSYAESIPSTILINLLNNDNMQVQGAVNLNRFLDFNTDDRLSNSLDSESYPFTERAVMCSILIVFLPSSGADSRYVPYGLIAQISYDRFEEVDEFIPGASYMMLRGYEQRTDMEHFVQTLHQFQHANINWNKEMSRCKALMNGAFENLGASLDIWDESNAYNDLIEKTARMFVCLTPQRFDHLQEATLENHLEDLNLETFYRQQGNAIVQKIFSMPANLRSSIFQKLGNLNKFLTMDIIQSRAERYAEFLSEDVLTISTLKIIATYNDDPLLFNYLFARARGTGKFTMPQAGLQVTDLDVQNVGPFISILSTADIQNYNDLQIEESIAHFQGTGVKAGPAFLLVQKFLRNRISTQDTVTMTQTDFQDIGYLLPALDYRYFANCSVSSLQDALPMFQNVAIRQISGVGMHLTTAQMHIIALRIQEDAGRSASLMTRLGPRIAMSLSPSYFLERLTDTDDFFTVRAEDGEITEDKGGFLTNDWTPFQKSVLFSMYKQPLRTLKLTGRMLNSLKSLATGISAQDILSADYSQILGITSAVMKAGGDMNKAWLLAVQIRKAYASVYGLEQITDFHLGLLGTANLQALDGLVLRNFGIREMERLSLADCNDVIAKIGDYEDVYLIPPPKRRELVCFYLARCRVSLGTTNRFSPVYEENNWMGNFFNDLNSDADEYEQWGSSGLNGGMYRRLRNNYCGLVTSQLMDTARLEQSDFDALGNLVCDLPSYAFRSVQSDVLEPNLWMFDRCVLDSDQSSMLFQQHIRGMVQGDSAPYVIRSLGASLCSIVPYNYLITSGANPTVSDSTKNELIEYVHYAYSEYYKMEDAYGLTKAHLNYGLFAFRDVSKSQQSRIDYCFTQVSRAVFANIDDIVQSENMDTTLTDNRLNYQQSTNNNWNSFNDNNYNNDVNTYNDFGDDNSVDDSNYNYNLNRQRRTSYYDSMELNCPSIQILGPGARTFSLRQLQRMQPQQLAQCIEYFGINFNLTESQRRQVKDDVESLFRGFENIFPEYLVQMKWLVTEMTRDELLRLDVGNRQAMYHISYWPWYRWQRMVLWQNIRTTFNFQLSSMGVAQFKSLGEFFCGMSSSEIASITPETYYEMATFVGELTTCDYNQMRTLLSKARSPNAFGEIEHWEERHVIAIGSAISGMSSTHLEMLTPGKNRLSQNLVAAIPAHVIPMIPDSVIENLEVEFFESLTPEQIVAFTPRQWHDMKKEQARAAMDIWFGYDEWPYSYLKGFREAGFQSFSLSPILLLIVMFINLRYAFY